MLVEFRSRLQVHNAFSAALVHSVNTGVLEMTLKKNQSFQKFITPNQQMSFSEYAAAIYKGTIIAVPPTKRRKKDGKRKTVPVRGYDRRKRKQ